MMLRFITIAALSALGICADWPEFRGPAGQGISTATNLPISWNATSNVLWRIETPGRGWSSPVVVDSHIYLTAAAGEGQGTTLRALCFNAEDGKLVWNRELFRPAPGETRPAHKKNGLASPTPILKNGLLFVHFGHMGTACLDTAGKIIWTNQVKYSPVHGNGGSPVLFGGLLMFNCDAAADPFVVALDAGTGALRWKTERKTHAKSRFSFSTPLVIDLAGKPQLISPGSGFVGSYDPASGRELWRARYGEGYSVIPRPVFAHGMIFVSSGYDRPEVYAVKVAGASGDVTDTHIAWSTRRGAPNTPSMLALGDELYFVSDAGIASCLDARTGTVHWSERLGGDFSASPLLAENRLYFQNELGVGFVVKPARHFQLISRNDLGERTLASPAAIDNALIIRSEGHLWRIGRR